LDAGNAGPFDSSYEDATQYGADAYAKFAPKVQSSDAMQFMFDDVKDLPQQLKTTAKGFHNVWKAMGGHPTLFKPKEVANQFLNVQFGWIPFISDVKSLYKTYNNIDKLVGQQLRDNGHWIKRKGTMFNSKVTSDIETVADFAGLVYPPLNAGFYRSEYPYVTSNRYSTTERKVWFEGSFRYWIPSMAVDHQYSDPYHRILNKVRQYGIRVSPTVIWELTPWSWLVDWFSNEGSIINNFTQATLDQLVNRYAYVMCYSKVHNINDSYIHLKKGTVHCFWVQEIESKRRAVANPFGFSLSDTGLSVRQSMILTALGITHGSHGGNHP
jgi:hypothetical protein